MYKNYFKFFQVLLFLIIFQLLMPSKLYAQYCKPEFINDYNIYHITNVTFGNSSHNTPGLTGAYTDYTSLPATDVFVDNTATGTVKIVLNGWNTNEHTLVIWVNLKAGDEDFDDDGERFIFKFKAGKSVSNPTKTIIVPFSIPIPNTVKSGLSIVRIGVRDGISKDFTACDFNDKAGEVEDYPINFLAESGYNPADELEEEPEYCVPKNLNSRGDFYISNFAIGTLNNSSTGTAGNYTYYKDVLPTDIKIGSPITATISVIVPSYYNSTDTVVIWRNLNEDKDDDFNDPDEPILKTVSFKNNTSAKKAIEVEIEVPMPNSIKPGNSILRVGIRIGNSNNFTACDFKYGAGELEDYRVKFVSEIVSNKSSSIAFDGVKDYLNSPSFIGNLREATIMSWIKIEHNKTVNLPNNYTIAGQETIQLFITKARTLTFKIYTQEQYNSESSFPNNSLQVQAPNNVKFKNDMWYHVAGVFDANTQSMKLYINGVLVNSINNSRLNSELLNKLSNGSQHPYSTSGFFVGKHPSEATKSEYFKGNIDEVRVFKKALSDAQLQQMVFQEVEKNNGNVRGKIIPEDIQDFETKQKVGWSDLIAYYPMTLVKGAKTIDASDNRNDLTLNNLPKIQDQTAPMPYLSNADGDWSDKRSWLHGDVWGIADESNNNVWSIVHIKSNVKTSSDHKTLGLIVDAGKKLEVNNDQAIENSLYLKLDGFIALQGESQLVQTANSVLVTGTNSKLNRDQQGTANKFTYNYWSSPVHSVNTDKKVNGNETFTVANVMFDGTDVSNPIPINFVGGSDGNNATKPISIAKSWIYKFANRPDNSYAGWQKVVDNGVLKVGEGFTMKGPGNGPIKDQQNYVFSGIPNNGKITLELFAGNEYLIGNPYPSAIDAYQFLLANKNVISGTLYFWEHYGGGSHNLADYQGGYGMYNLSGGTPPLAGSNAKPNGDVSQNGTPTKTPKRYIPVAQGFFVTAQAGGTVIFENEQRVFVKEDLDNKNSSFFRSSSEKKEAQINEIQINEDNRPKFRIGYKSPNNHKRQVLLTVDENATTAIDWGFDGELNEDNVEDVFWKIEDRNYLIQGIDAILETTVLPLTVKTKNGGVIEISIDALEHVADNQLIYLKDGSYYHNLRASNYKTNVSPGTVNDQFQLVFTDGVTLSNTEQTTREEIKMYFDKNLSAVVIQNPTNIDLSSFKITNLLGQNVIKKSMITSENQIVVPVNLQTSVYIVTLEGDATHVSQKMLITN